MLIILTLLILLRYLIVFFESDEGFAILILIGFLSFIFILARNEPINIPSKNPTDTSNVSVSETDPNAQKEERQKRRQQLMDEYNIEVQQKRHLEENERQLALEKKRLVEAKEQEMLLKLASIKEETFQRQTKDLKESIEYNLIKNFAKKYDLENLDENQHFIILANMMQNNWAIGRDDLKRLLVEEKNKLEYQIIHERLDSKQSRDYDTYLKIAYDVYGEKIDSKIDILVDFLKQDFEGLYLSRDLIKFKLEEIDRINKEDALRKHLSDDSNLISLSIIDSFSPAQFEKFIADLFKKKGYKASVTPTTGDQGADVILEKMGERTAVQVKLYSKPVSNRAVQEVVAAMKHYDTTRGMVVTNNYFSKSAILLARSNKIQLIDRDELAKML